MRLAPAAAGPDMSGLWSGAGRRTAEAGKHTRRCALNDKFGASGVPASRLREGLAGAPLSGQDPNPRPADVPEGNGGHGSTRDQDSSTLRRADARHFTQHDTLGGGRPVVIHARGRVFALSPEAEDAGLRADMPLGQAYAICPHAESLPYDEDLYRAAQERVLDICAAHVSVIEPAFPHELFLDLAGTGEPAQVMAEIAEAIEADAGFTCRAGAASSKLAARVAALEARCRSLDFARDKHAGPTGSEGNGGRRHARPTDSRGSQDRAEASRRPDLSAVAETSRPIVVSKGSEAEFLAPLPLSRLWLLDKDTVEHLKALGITTIGLLQQIPVGQLTQRFGRMGRRLSELAHGVDRSPVRACYPPPVIETRGSLAGGAQDLATVEAGLRRLSRKAAAQLRSRDQGCRRLGLEVETDGGGSTSQWLRTSTAIAGEGEMLRAAERLLKRVLERNGRANLAAPITALTLRAADLQRCAGVQLDLLGEREQETRQRERLNDAIASAHKRFGARSVRWAREVEVPRRERMLACLRDL